MHYPCCYIMYQQQLRHQLKQHPLKRAHGRCRSSIAILSCIISLVAGVLISLLLLSSVPCLYAKRILPSTRLNSTLFQKHQYRHRQEHEQTNTIPKLHRQQQVYVKVPTDPAEHLITEPIPLLVTPLTTQQWAGHLPASPNKDKYFFYWLFAPDTTADASSSTTIPIIIWLNGGPACSSMDGLFIENGPYMFEYNESTNKYELKHNPYSWHKVPAYTLYIDQPVGTGLSFTTSAKYPTNDLEVNIDFYYFLQQFFVLHSDKFVIPHSTKETNKIINRPLYFSGESYAGHYIPSMINYILQQNTKIEQENSKNDMIVIPVAGAAIGNGWTDPFYQYAGADFAYGHGLIGASQLYALREQEILCQNEINKGIYSTSTCFDLIDSIIDSSFGSSNDYKVSGYDIRVAEKKHGSRDFPPNHKIIETYLGGWSPPHKGTISTLLYKQVLEVIHATAATDAQQTYQECTDPPYNALAGNDGKGVVDDVLAVLQYNSGKSDNELVHLLFFNGIYDIICNHVGNEKFLEKLNWEHVNEWYQQDRYAWIAPSQNPDKQYQVSGYMKEYKNLHFLKILNAGHMVPMDVPDVALEMMKLLLYGKDGNNVQQMYQQDIQSTTIEKSEGKSCSVCPTCLVRDSAASSNSNNDNSSSKGSVTMSYYWFLVIGSVMIFMMVYIMVSSSSRRKHRATNNAVIPAVQHYELELRDTSSSIYRDNDEDYDDDNDTRTAISNGRKEIT